MHTHGNQAFELEYKVIGRIFSWLGMVRILFCHVQLLQGKQDRPQTVAALACNASKSRYYLVRCNHYTSLQLIIFYLCISKMMMTG